MNGKTVSSSERVLIHTPYGRDGSLIQEILRRSNIEGEVCSSTASLESSFKEGAGAAVIGDEALSQATVESLAGCLRQQPQWSDFPLLIMTRGGDESEGSQRRLQLIEPLGNVTLIERPVRTATLVSSVRAALRARRHQYQIRDHLARREEDANALRESERRYRTLAEALPQLVWTCLPNGCCDYWNGQWVTYTGIPSAAQLGTNWLETVVHPHDRERTSAAWKTAVEDRSIFDIEFRLRRHDGAYRWFKSRGTPVRDGSGEIVKWFGTCTDIDDQKKTEEDRQRLLDSEQSARRTAELLNGIGPILLAERDPRTLAQRVTDIATQLTRAQFGALFQKLKDEKGESYMLYTLSGVPREAFSNIPMPRDTEIFAPTFHNQGILRSDDITQDPRYGTNAPYYGMPGGHLPVKSYLAVPVVSGTGQVLGGLFFGHSSIGVFREQDEAIVSGIAAQAAIALDNARLFTEARLAQEAIQRSNEELRQANDELQQFAYSASHDLQEPLRMVSIYSQMLKKKYAGRLDSQADGYLSYTVEGASRMEQLLKDLLLYSQSASLAEPPAQAVKVNPSLESALQNLRAAISESGASIHYGNLSEVCMHEVHLRQLFQNLIGNAIKYRSVQPVCIHIRSMRRDGAWLCSVTDNGIGIDKNYAEYIFGIFKRLHGGGEYSGTGIGLAICKKIVERYGGRIWVESEPGRGSSFFFSIPDRPAERAARGDGKGSNLDYRG